jgi:hypothetical protein
MLVRLLAGCLMMAVCVIIHAGGVTWAIRHVRRAVVLSPGFWWGTWLFVRLAMWMVLLHLTEISAWAAMYVWNGAMPDMASAVYFSAVTYTTVGYGDLVLAPGWRIDGGIEALTGILMCGWSTGFFMTVVNRLYERQT